jgi:AraC-like DNA-binding protein
MSKSTNNVKIKDGFSGSKQIDIPLKIIENCIKIHPLICNLFIKNIGFYPNAKFHYRFWGNGCPENILIYCVNGKGWFKSKKKVSTISKNEFILIESGKEPISYGSDEKDPWTIYWIHFTGAAISDFNQTYADKVNVVSSILFDNLRISLWTEMFDWLSSGYSLENLCKSNFCLPHFISSLLYAQMVTKKGNENKLIKDIIQYMQMNLANQISSQTIANHFNLSGSHIRMLFRKVTGIPINEYLINLRIQKSCNLLISSDLRMSEISDQAGFVDPYYFSRCFKKEIGLSPFNYRKLCR